MDVSLSGAELRGDFVGGVFVEIGPDQLTRFFLNIHKTFFAIHFEFGPIRHLFFSNEEAGAIAFAESVGLDIAPILEQIETARYQIEGGAAA